MVGVFVIRDQRKVEDRPVPAGQRQGAGTLQVVPLVQRSLGLIGQPL